MNHLLSSSLAIIFPWCSVWLTEVPSWESPGRSFSDLPLPSPWSLSSSSDSIPIFFLMWDLGFSSLPSGVDFWPFSYYSENPQDHQYFSQKESDLEDGFLVNHLPSFIWFSPEEIFSFQTFWFRLALGEELDLRVELDDLVWSISSFSSSISISSFSRKPQSFHLKIPGIGLWIGLVGGPIELITVLITLHTKSLRVACRVQNLLIKKSTIT